VSDEDAQSATGRSGPVRRTRLLAGPCLLARSLLLAAIVVAGVPADAAAALATSSASATPSAVGYDVSFPQCEASPPQAPSFAIVGVDGGLANDANPCLAQQLSWASAAPGLTRPAQPGLSLYLDAADPGSGVADWPSPDAGTAGVATPYGPCDGSWSRACAFVNGVLRAGYAYGLAVAAAPPVATAELPPTATVLSPAASAPWWIDVEIGASWAGRSSSREWAKLNLAALRGYVAGLRDAGARGPVGLYSNAYQWHVITGLRPRASRAYFTRTEHDWITGARSFAQAPRACAAAFSGSVVTLAQFTEGGLDRDYACPSRPARIASRSERAALG
jgi:hypothetical protein